MNEITTISQARMSAFLDTITQQARELLHERTEDILHAWHSNIEEAMSNDKKMPPLRISVAASVDLDRGCIETTARFSAIYSSSLAAPLPDPNQPALPGIE